MERGYIIYQQAGYWYMKIFLLCAFTFTFMHLADAFYPKRLTTAFRLYICIVSICVPWESNPQPLRCKRNALPLSHRNTGTLCALLGGLAGNRKINNSPLLLGLEGQTYWSHTGHGNEARNALRCRWMKQVWPRSELLNTPVGMRAGS